MTGFVVFLKEFIALYYWYIELFTRKILNIHAWITSCPDGITPNSGLTGPKIYLNICIALNKLRGAYDKFPDFFRIGIYNCCRLLKTHYVIAIQLMRWLTNLYDFSFKWTATAGIGIHPTKVWSSQQVKFKNAIWTWGHFRRTIYNKILFWTWKKYHRNVWNASDCFSTILHESTISFWVA